ncbi:hypothetical protein O181_083261 [Austropuccinia psidii MF-1]|uniref:Uncharacterized protein n=1 Tax=Austropuccinia psidii MF-1 TaxID=1389203 RepID=A0A9Q3FU86_9BASI|nr:hypothetical protein [Austropuccinia psidii MF-1]
MTAALETEGPVVSTSSKPAQEDSKDKPKGPQKKKKGSRTINARAKAKPIGTDLTHKGTGFLTWSLQQWTVSLK